MNYIFQWVELRKGEAEKLYSIRFWKERWFEIELLRVSANIFVIRFRLFSQGWKWIEKYKNIFIHISILNVIKLRYTDNLIGINIHMLKKNTISSILFDLMYCSFYTKLNNECGWRRRHDFRRWFIGGNVRTRMDYVFACFREQSPWKTWSWMMKITSLTDTLCGFSTDGLIKLQNY